MRIKHVIIETEDGLQYLIEGAQITEATMSSRVDPNTRWDPETGEPYWRRVALYEWELRGTGTQTSISLPPMQLTDGK